MRWLIVCATVAAGHAQATRHQQQRVTGEYTLDGCPAHVRWRDASFPNALMPDQPSTVFWLQSLFTPEEAVRLVKLLQKASFSDAADSTDHLPSYELYLLTGGQPASSSADGIGKAAALRIRALIMPRFKKCVLPFVREKFNCPACMPCISLARRYQPDERTEVQPHRDALARVTVVVELQPAQAGPKGGGLFIQQAEDAPTNFVPMRPGDAFLHDYELLHGVRVACAEGDASCARYSLVMWLREGEDECRAGGDVEAAIDMYKRSAAAGIAEGRYSYARKAIQLEYNGRYGVRREVVSDGASAAEKMKLVEEVVEHLVAATQQGHADSAVFLAELHLEGVPGAIQADASAAQRWRRQAREMGGGSQLAAWEETRRDKLARHDEL